MILWLFRYLRGFVSIKLSGVQSEEILRKLTENKIVLWRLKFSKGDIFCCLLAKDFKHLRSVRRGTGIRIKIIKRYGLPFIIKKYKNRVGFIIGIALFFAVLKFLSTFIWVINVDGNKKVDTASIIATLKSIGVYETVKSSDLDAKQKAQELLLARNDLAWASLNIEGSVLNVNVTEIKEKARNDDGNPTNLVAARDGIIKRIDAVAGNVTVKVGDNVHKGDILVSGIIESTSSIVFTRSSAVVTAQVEKTYEQRADFSQIIKRKTGKTETRRVIEFLGVRIPLFLAHGYKNADCVYEVWRVRIFGKPVPVKCYSERFEYYSTVKLVFGAEELKPQLLKQLNDYLDAAQIEGYIPINTGYVIDDDGVIITHKYLCDENIAKQSVILTA